MTKVREAVAAEPSVEDLSTKRVGKFTALKVDIIADNGLHCDRILIGHRLQTDQP